MKSFWAAITQQHVLIIVFMADCTVIIMLADFLFQVTIFLCKTAKFGFGAKKLSLNIATV